MRLREFGSIENGNVVVVSCLGLTAEGEPHCGGILRIPFSPALAGCELALRPDGTRPVYWDREEGDSVDTITLEPSIDAGVCGHFEIVRGDIRRRVETTK